ncbi:hypothetical protein EUBC25_04810 [Claveliimonas bilis]|uniref:Sak single strand annealing protein n=1 Tax=Claveliimonas bilis TaxID=3028070 RepID=UPI001E332421|nr:DUF1071 domain-containing protein [Claveliimonas bilis]BCZ26394.1 hypothetical protein EUBC25_04810 [Claveliimonas bilis]
MLKSYEELRNIDVKRFCKKRDGLDYLPWAMCVKLLHDNGAEVVRWEPIPDPSTGSSLIMSNQTFTDSKGNTNRCYETRIRVTIDDKEYEMQTPVMNGANPVKDNSMSQQRVWNSMCRAFVKCVALNTGLGFDLWLKEEDGNDPYIPESLEKLATPAKIKTVKNLCASHGIDADMWVTSNGKTWDTLTEKEAAQMLGAIKQRYGDE